MQVICLEEEAFYALINKIIEYIEAKTVNESSRWIDSEEVMSILKISSKTTLQKLRDNGEIRFSQPLKKIILYDRESINAYIERHARGTF